MLTMGIIIESDGAYADSNVNELLNVIRFMNITYVLC